MIDTDAESIRDRVNATYDTQMLCTYQIELSSGTHNETRRTEDEEENIEMHNMLYNIQLSQVFLCDDLSFVDPPKLLQRIEKLYEIIRDVEFVKTLISINRHKTIFDSNNDEEKNFLLFQTLFSYDYFHMFHKCMIYFFSNISSEEKMVHCINELTRALSSK